VLTFDWQVAIGEQFVTRAEFERLVRRATGIVRFRGEYVFLDPVAIERLRAQLDRPPQPDGAELLRTALAGEWEGAPVRPPRLDQAGTMCSTTILRRAVVDQLGPFDEVAGYRRTLSSRVGFAALLLWRGAPLAFVKLRPEGDAGHASNVEELALRMIEASWPRSFSAPRLLAAGVVGPWRYFCTSALPSRLHRAPSSPPLSEITAEIQAGLAALPRPTGTPSHWQGMHGDFTPWNLRQSGPRMFLVDWEHAGWGPPNADEIGYRLAAALIGVSTGAMPWSPTPNDLEAIRFWAAQASGWTGSRRDDQYVARALRMLGAMERQVSAMHRDGHHGGECELISAR